MIQKSKILFVSDDLHLIELVEKDIELNVYDVSCALPKDASQLFNSHRFEIVLIDLRENSKSSLGLIKRINADNPSLPISVIVEESPCQELIDALESGAKNYTACPTSVDKIKTLIIKSLGLSARNRNRHFGRSSFSSGEISLELPSVSRAVPPTVELFRSLLSGFYPRRELLRIALAIDEVLRNAYEHGNLGITSSEKNTACNNDTFEELLSQREKIALSQNKLIRVKFNIEDSFFSCSIQDDGIGFDWKEAQSKGDQIGSAMNLQGRGVYLVKSVFDEIIYNDSGNKVTLKKAFPSTN